MRINSISSYTPVYSLYNTMYQGSLSLSGIKLNKSLFPFNQTKSSNQLGEGALQYVSNIKSASKSLSGTLNKLSGAAFTKKGAVSSDSDIMSVKYTGSNPNSIKQTSVKVDQTAAGQMNEGTSLNANTSFGSSGANKFSININGKTTELSVNVAVGDTNKAVQQKMADAINSAGLGLKATVETDSANSASMLKIEATSTGNNDKSKFSVADITGNLAARTGANDVSRAARDAVFSVDGGEKRTSQSNNVDLGGGLSVTFNKSSEKAVTISAGRDMDFAKSSVSDLVKSYNDLYIEAAQKLNDPKAQNLATKMINTSKTYLESLSNIGIGFDKDGKMTLDDAKLNAAAENGKLENFFTENSGKNYGFTNQLSKLADNVTRNTGNYVSSSVLGNSLTENFAYSGFAELIQYSYLNSGLLFDYSF